MLSNGNVISLQPILIQYIFMSTLINIFSLVGSLALFLYGMKIMSEGLEKFAGDRLRSILGAMTKNRLMGVLTGVGITPSSNRRQLQP